MDASQRVRLGTDRDQAATASRDWWADDAASPVAEHAVVRQVPEADAIATAALQELFSGRVTEQERSAGLRSGFGPQTADLLNRLRIADGVAYVDLDGSRRDAIAYASTSCGSGVFGSAIRSTLLQFPTVTEVRYAFDGDPRDFVEWSQGGCPEEPIPPGDPCDPRPWSRDQGN
jgi:spore germination protein GerM